MVSHALLFSLLMFAQTTSDAPKGLLPFDGRWEYPHYLTFRPGNGQVCRVNPPRFSWPYVPHVVTGKRTIPAQEFRFQLSKTGDFSNPDVEIRTPYNFYNALSVLDETVWRWRVGYGVGTKEEQWSPVRSFTFAPDAVEWDRTIIKDAARRLAEKPHPRLAPAEGWQEWLRSLEKNERTNAWMDELLRRARRVTQRQWWSGFPKSDRKGEAKYSDQQFARMAGEIALASFVYRLTGDKRYLPAKDHALAMARFPKGGLASPEFHGAPRKWPTQIAEYLALCLDWWRNDLTGDERKTLLNSIDWRLRATFLEKASWRMGKNIARQGVSVFCQSHPYENFMWSLPAVLLTCGDLSVSDDLAELCLHYLTGVTSAHGPDEGWNEGLAYGSWKGQTMLHASLYTDLLLPELALGCNPFYQRLGEWYAFIMPLGIKRLSFGDYAATPDRHRRVQMNNFRSLAWLTGDARFVHRWQMIAKEIGDSLSARPWLDLFQSSSVELPPPMPDRSTRAVFPEAGWVMTGTGQHSDREAFKDAVGMIFKCRPRGGFSHSYRAENDFVWYAYGETLSAGGGGTAYPDPHSRRSLSHNVVLIDGKGQEWNPWDPIYPFVGRLLYYKGQEWVGDATCAYQTIPGLLRWHRRVALVGGKWFAMLDDLAMRPDADPARFSWLMHIAPKAPLSISEDGASFSFRIGDVHARVAFANDPKSIEIVDMQGRDGFRNVITGEDLYPETVKRLASKGRDLPEEKWMAHNVWVTNRRPAREWTFLTALVAWREGERAPRISFKGDRSVSVSWLGAPRREGDGISQDATIEEWVFESDGPDGVEAIRAHAVSTNPAVLPPAGRVETLNLDGDNYRVEWLAKETFDTNDWLSRWIIEGNSEVSVRNGRLWVRNIHPKRANVATLWFRPDLPTDVVVRFRAEATPPAERNAANLNIFLHAREQDGSRLRFGRSGQYKEYHKIPNYIVTLTGGVKPGWSRARRDPGFNLMHEANVRSEVGKEYNIAVALHKGRLRYYLNGRRIHDVQDPHPLPGGKFAIRTWSTNAWWDDVEIGRIMSADD